MIWTTPMNSHELSTNIGFLAANIYYFRHTVCAARCIILQYPVTCKKVVLDEQPSTTQIGYKFFSAPKSPDIIQICLLCTNFFLLSISNAVIKMVSTRYQTQ